MKQLNKLVSSIMLASLALQPISAYAYTKNETVFSNIDYNGTVIETTVNNHLSKLDNASIEDESLLEKIKNLNGSEEYKQEESKLIWNSNGKDIFYQGKSSEELPVTASIDYYLDGEKTTPKKMLNKKGQVTIKMSLKNNSYIPSKKLHTPFVVTAGIMLDQTKDTNIEITNGEVTETGTRSMALALAAPGLYEDLKIKELKSLDEIIINYDTEKFTLNNIYFVATPKVLSRVDITNLNKVNNLDSSIKTIQENMNKLDDGAKILNDGASKIDSGSREINASLNTALQAIKKLEAGSNSLNDGLKQTITSLENVKSMLEDKDIATSLENVKTLITTNENTIALLENTNEGLKINYETYNLKNFNTDEELITYFTNLGQDNYTINNLLTCKKTYEANQNIINLLSINTNTLKAMTSSLQEIYQSVNSLIFELNKGLSLLENGSSNISRGLKQLNSGVEKIYGGSSNLIAGTYNLKSGADNLSNGITTLNKEGINKLTESSSTLTNYSHKVKELVRLSKDYKGYSSSNSNKTTFIYKVKSAK